MQKLSGIHLYINIANYDKIILDDLDRFRDVAHSIHALDTFFSSIESFGKKISPDHLVVEKVTGARLHLYIVDKADQAYEVVRVLSFYAYQLSRYINTNIPKYKTLMDFHINVGAAYGDFYEFEFIKDEYSELTTIGYVANIAAKLQAQSEIGKINIAENLYDSLSDCDKEIYEWVVEPTLAKYDQIGYYQTDLSKISSHAVIPDEEMERVRDYVSMVDLGEIEFAGIRSALNFKTLNKKQCKSLEGIPVFADIRGFTSQFEEDDSNLEEMASKTQNVLEAMYQVSTLHGGVHIQFQGDRELSLYHNIPEQKTDKGIIKEQTCFKSAVLAAMRIVDVVMPYSVHVGVGEDFGRLFATKIGARGEKDNILLGEPVTRADIMEDEMAGRDQVAISPRVYNSLKKEDPHLAEQFKKKGNCYVSQTGYQQYYNDLSDRMLRFNNRKRNYNGAWGDLV